MTARIWSDQQLQAYLNDELSESELSSLESDLRANATLRERLESLSTLDEIHSVGEIWRRHRLSCPSREELQPETGRPAFSRALPIHRIPSADRRLRNLQGKLCGPSIESGSSGGGETAATIDLRILRRVPEPSTKKIAVAAPREFNPRVATGRPKTHPMTSYGKVYLVGAGPGDPGLLSLRGRECLELADVVLYDGLVNPLLLRHTHARCERTSRMSGPDGKRLPQEKINRHLVEAAQSGKTVVRLKGGDPFVFGRGSEEAAALRAAGIKYEIVPGITAAVAAAEYAGISITHRDHASAVAFVTGHEDPTKSVHSIDYSNLARFSGTLVFYMGLHRLPDIVESLISAGKNKDTPACVISQGTRTEQRTVTAVLQDLPAQVNSAALVAPSLIVIGDCVLMREELQWFENRPLFGVRIAIPRPVPQAYETADLAYEWGAVPLLLPTISIEPPADWTEVDRTLREIEQHDWLIFTSRNGVSFFFDRFFELGHDARKLGQTQIAVIGSATADALAEYHLHADLVPETFRAEVLAAELVEHVREKKVLWCGADRGS